MVRAHGPAAATARVLYRSLLRTAQSLGPEGLGNGVCLRKHATAGSDLRKVAAEIPYADALTNGNRNRITQPLLVQWLKEEFRTGADLDVGFAALRLLGALSPDQPNAGESTAQHQPQTQDLAAAEEEGSRWPAGMSRVRRGRIAMLPPAPIHELLFEVGWCSRHKMVDVRSAPSGGVPSALSVPFEPANTFVTRARAAGLEPGTRVVVSGVDATDMTALAAAEALVEAGHGTVLILDGGVAAWNRARLPCAVYDAADGPPAR